MVLFYTLIFGNHNLYLSLLIKSFNQTTGNLIILGNVSTPLWMQPVPNNINYVLTTWYNMTKRLEIFLSRQLTTIHNTTNIMKVNDFKPLIPALYPELFSHSMEDEWIGWIDNDIWLSQAFIDALPDKKSDVDFIQITGTRNGMRSSFSALACIRKHSYYHIIVPILSKNSPMLFSIFRRKVTRDFAGWGVASKGGLGHQNSFSFILEKAIKAHHLSPVSLTKLSSHIPYVLDHICEPSEVKMKFVVFQTNKIINDACGYCLMDQRNNKTILTNNNNQIVLFCHFQCTKYKLIREGRFDDSIHHNHILMNAKKIFSTYLSGINVQQQ